MVVSQRLRGRTGVVGGWWREDSTTVNKAAVPTPCHSVNITSPDHADLVQKSNLHLNVTNIAKLVTTSHITTTNTMVSARQRSSFGSPEYVSSLFPYPYVLYWITFNHVYMSVLFPSILGEMFNLIGFPNRGTPFDLGELFCDIITMRHCDYPPSSAEIWLYARLFQVLLITELTAILNRSWRKSSTLVPWRRPSQCTPTSRPTRVVCTNTWLGRRWEVTPSKY